MSGREQALGSRGWMISRLVALPRSGAVLLGRGLAWEEMLAAAVPRACPGWWTVWAEHGALLTVTGRTADLGLRKKSMTRSCFYIPFILGAVRIGGRWAHSEKLIPSTHKSAV